MTLADSGAIGGIIVAAFVVGGLVYRLVYQIVCLVRKVNLMDQLLITLTPIIIEAFYKKTNDLSGEKEMEDLLGKLGGRHKLTPTQGNKLTQILKGVQAEAKREGRQDTALATTALIILSRLVTEKQSQHSG